MSKAVLVMDMPESCSKCMFLYEFGGIKNCNLMNVMYGGASRLSQNNFTKCRHDQCPLRPMPEKKEILHTNQYQFGVLGRGFSEGWNACIDKILGGAE